MSNISHKNNRVTWVNELTSANAANLTTQLAYSDVVFFSYNDTNGKSKANSHGDIYKGGVLYTYLCDVDVNRDNVYNTLTYSRILRNPETHLLEGQSVGIFPESVNITYCGTDVDANKIRFTYSYTNMKIGHIGWSTSASNNTCICSLKRTEGINNTLTLNKITEDTTIYVKANIRDNNNIHHKVQSKINVTYCPAESFKITPNVVFVQKEGTVMLRYEILPEETLDRDVILYIKETNANNFVDIVNNKGVIKGKKVNIDTPVTIYGVLKNTNIRSNDVEVHVLPEGTLAKDMYLDQHEINKTFPLDTSVEITANFYPVNTHSSNDNLITWKHDSALDTYFNFSVENSIKHKITITQKSGLNQDNVPATISGIITAEYYNGVNKISDYCILNITKQTSQAGLLNGTLCMSTIGDNKWETLSTWSYEKNQTNRVKFWAKVDDNSLPDGTYNSFEIKRTDNNTDLQAPNTTVEFGRKKKNGNYYVNVTLRSGIQIIESNIPFTATLTINAKKNGVTQTFTASGRFSLTPASSGEYLNDFELTGPNTLYYCNVENQKAKFKARPTRNDGRTCSWYNGVPSINNYNYFCYGILSFEDGNPSWTNEVNVDKQISNNTSETITAQTSVVSGNNIIQKAHTLNVDYNVPEFNYNQTNTILECVEYDKSEILNELNINNVDSANISSTTISLENSEQGVITTNKIKFNTWANERINDDPDESTKYINVKVLCELNNTEFTTGGKFNSIIPVSVSPIIPSISIINGNTDLALGDVYALLQASAYVEDNYTWYYSTNYSPNNPTAAVWSSEITNNTTDNGFSFELMPQSQLKVKYNGSEQPTIYIKAKYGLNGRYTKAFPLSITQSIVYANDLTISTDRTIYYMNSSFDSDNKILLTADVIPSDVSNTPSVNLSSQITKYIQNGAPIKDSDKITWKYNLLSNNSTVGKFDVTVNIDDKTSTISNLEKANIELSDITGENTIWYDPANLLGTSQQTYTYKTSIKNVNDDDIINHNLTWSIINGAAYIEIISQNNSQAIINPTKGEGSTTIRATVNNTNQSVSKEFTITTKKATFTIDTGQVITKTNVGDKYYIFSNSQKDDYRTVTIKYTTNTGREPSVSIKQGGQDKTSDFNYNIKENKIITITPKDETIIGDDYIVEIKLGNITNTNYKFSSKNIVKRLTVQTTFKLNGKETKSDWKLSSSYAEPDWVPNGPYPTYYVFNGTKITADIKKYNSASIQKSTSEGIFFEKVEFNSNIINNSNHTSPTDNPIISDNINEDIEDLLYKVYNYDETFAIVQFTVKQTSIPTNLSNDLEYTYDISKTYEQQQTTFDDGTSKELSSEIDSNWITNNNNYATVNWVYNNVNLSKYTQTLDFLAKIFDSNKNSLLDKSKATNELKCTVALNSSGQSYTKIWNISVFAKNIKVRVNQMFINYHPTLYNILYGSGYKIKEFDIDSGHYGGASGSGMIWTEIDDRIEGGFQHNLSIEFSTSEHNGNVLYLNNDRSNQFFKHTGSYFYFINSNKVVNSYVSLLSSKQYTSSISKPYSKLNNTITLLTNTTMSFEFNNSTQYIMNTLENDRGIYSEMHSAVYNDTIYGTYKIINNLNSNNEIIINLMYKAGGAWEYDDVILNQENFNDYDGNYNSGSGGGGNVTPPENPTDNSCSYRWEEPHLILEFDKEVNVESVSCTSHNAIFSVDVVNNAKTWEAIITTDHLGNHGTFNECNIEITYTTVSTGERTTITIGNLE